MEILRKKADGDWIIDEILKKLEKQESNLNEKD